MQTLTLLQLFACFVTFETVKSLYAGDQCTHEKKNAIGVCKLLDKCPSAIADLKRGVFPQNCGFENSAVVVCCVEDKPTTKVGDKCRQVCKDNEKFGYKKIVPPTVIGEVQSVNLDICLWSPKALSVIVEGEKATEGEFPHMALLGYGTPENHAWLCGGSLISEKFVLTAAHCLYARDFGEPKFVRLGDLNYTNPNDDEYAQQINIKKIHTHPDYKYPLQYNDVALLELETLVKLSLHVKPACLYTKEPAGISNGIITGWGITENNTVSQHLLKAVVEEFTPQVCNKTYRSDKRTLPRGLDPRTQVCYGSNSNRKDTCQGDSGGPIQIYAKDVHCSYYVFGITSFGKGCGTTSIAAVYVNLYPFIEWIEKIVWP